MSPANALFPQLTGAGFAALHPPVQAVHGGASGSWQGRASVQRGGNVLLQMAAAVAGLPATQRDVPTRVTIEAGADHETWTRYFGAAAPMRSTLSARHGLLAETLGPVTLQFRIIVRDGGMHWALHRIALLGVPLPRRCFRVQASAGSSGTAYRFLVAVDVRGLGELIRYEGELHVAG